MLLEMKKLLPLLILPILMLTSCQSFLIVATSGNVDIILNEDDETSNNYYGPDEVNLSQTRKTLQGVTKEVVMPSTGDVNCLVVPIIIKGYEDNATQEFLDLIDEAFNSDEPLKGGYPSIKSYFYESSFHQLNLSATVLDWIDLWEVCSIDENISTEQFTQNIFLNYLSEVIDYVSTLDIDLTQFDSDKDGYLDQVYFIYSAYDYQTLQDMMMYTEVDDFANSDVFWAYTINIRANNPYLDTDVPVLANYTVCSFDTLFKDYAKTKNVYYGNKRYQVDIISLDNDISPQTIIHETGHAMGLNDYYNYGDDYNYSPAGRLTMMDYNVGDFDSYSKMTLGWVKPYVVYGNSSIKLEESYVNKDQLIVIDPSQTSKDFNPFDEYILIEYYSPNGLNKYDIDNVINNYVPLPSQTGYKVYHIDSREFVTNLSNTIVREYDFEDLSAFENVVLPISNTNAGERAELSSYHFSPNVNVSNSFDEIRLIEGFQRNTFNKGGYFTYETLFYGDDYFTFSKYRSFFIYDSFNDGTAFPYQIYFK